MDAHRFFSNKECKYFPCHKKTDGENFNCLFCYCPLYYLAENCGGKFEYTPGGIKTCSGCDLPHTAEYYDIITAKLKEAGKKGGI